MYRNFHRVFAEPCWRERATNSIAHLSAPLDFLDIPQAYPSPINVKLVSSPPLLGASVFAITVKDSEKCTHELATLRSLSSILFAGQA
nr:hypothetical protein [uncultured Undibacterium sp.]